MILATIDYWILEELVFASCSIERIYSNPIFTNFCRARSRNRITVLKELLDRLVGHGLIAIVDNSGATSADLRSIIHVLDLSEMEEIRRKYCIMLTSAGGQAWESWAEPDWDRYIEDVWSDSFQLKDGKTLDLVETTAANEQRIAEFAEAIRFMNRGYACLGTSIDCESQWDTTYWKTLNRAFKQRLIVVVDLHQGSWKERESNRDHYTAFRQWYQRGFGSFAKMKMHLDNC